MLETCNLVRKYTIICSFNVAFSTKDLNFADVNIFFAKKSAFLLLLKAIVLLLAFTLSELLR